MILSATADMSVFILATIRLFMRVRLQEALSTHRLQITDRLSRSEEYSKKYIDKKRLPQNSRRIQDVGVGPDRSYPSIVYEVCFAATFLCSFYIIGRRNY